MDLDDPWAERPASAPSPPAPLGQGSGQDIPVPQYAARPATDLTPSADPWAAPSPSPGPIAATGPAGGASSSLDVANAWASPTTESAPGGWAAPPPIALPATTFDDDIDTGALPVRASLPVDDGVIIASGLPRWGDDAIDRAELHQQYSTSTSAAVQPGDEDDDDASSDPNEDEQKESRSEEKSAETTAPSEAEQDAKPSQTAAPTTAAASSSTGIKAAFSNLFSKRTASTAATSGQGDSGTSDATRKDQAERRPSASVDVNKRADVEPVSLSAYVLGQRGSISNDEPDTRTRSQQQPTASDSQGTISPVASKQTEQTLAQRTQQAAQQTAADAVAAVSAASSAAAAATAAAPSTASRLWARFAPSSGAAKGEPQQKQAASTDWTVGIDALADKLDSGATIQALPSSTSTAKGAGGAKKQNEADDDIWDVFGQPAGSGSGQAAATASRSEDANKSKRGSGGGAGLAKLLKFGTSNRPKPGQGTGLFDEDDEDEEEQDRERAAARNEQALAYPAPGESSSSRPGVTRIASISSTARAGVARSGTVKSSSSSTGRAPGGSASSTTDDAFAGLDAAFTRPSRAANAASVGGSSTTPTVGSGRGKGRYAFARPPIDVRQPPTLVGARRTVEEYDVDAVERDEDERRRRGEGGGSGGGGSGGLHTAFSDGDDFDAFVGAGDSALTGPAGSAYRDEDPSMGMRALPPRLAYDGADADKARRGPTGAEDDDDAVRYGYAPGQRDAHSPSLGLGAIAPPAFGGRPSGVGATSVSIGHRSGASSVDLGASQQPARSGTPRLAPPPPPPGRSGAGTVGADATTMVRSDSNASGSGSGRRVGIGLPPPPPPPSSSTLSSNASLAAQQVSMSQAPGQGQAKMGDLLSAALAPTPRASAPAPAPTQKNAVSQGPGLTADDLSFFERL